jgi:putative sugar O-methyltransferase
MSPQANRMTDDPELLDLMLEDMATRDFLFQPARYWEHVNLRLEQTIRQNGVTALRSSAHEVFRHFGASTFQDVSRISSLHNRYTHARLVRLLRNVPILGSLLSRIDSDIGRIVENERMIISKCMKAIYDLAEEIDRDGLSRLEDSLQGAPDHYVSRNGKFYTAECLSYFVNLRRATKDIDVGDSPKILEIGGGYGGLCEVATRLWGQSTYVIVDIPHTAYCSTQYLKACFPGRVVDYRQTRMLDRISVEDLTGRIVVLCPWQVDAIRSKFDLFFNFCSFQEMTPAIVQNYAQKVKMLVPGGNAFISCKAESHPVSNDFTQRGVSEPISSHDIRETFRDCELMWTRLHEAIPYYDGAYETVRFFVPELASRASVL